MGARFIDRETNTSEVEIRPPGEAVRTDIIHAHSKGLQVPSSNSELSSHDMNIIESPLARPHVPDTMLQLDGPPSVRTRRKRPVPEVRRYTTIPKGNYPEESESDSHDNRSHEGQRYPERRRHYQDRGGRPPDREGSQDGGYPGRGSSPDNGGPPMMEDPLMMEDPKEMEDCQEDLEDKDHQAHQDLLDQCVL